MIWVLTYNHNFIRSGHNTDPTRTPPSPQTATINPKPFIVNVTTQKSNQQILKCHTKTSLLSVLSGYQVRHFQALEAPRDPPTLQESDPSDRSRSF